MSSDRTEIQGGAERRRAREMSLDRGRPPAQVPGYELERRLGLGAYGEVWVAAERNTGRRVAIKFYAHRGGLDWSLLSREVEKLAFLFADRYVVQLLGVGWDADPPYYIMEYLENGSLADRLEQGPLAVEEAVGMFRDVATGLVHAHGKGVLHCDLKPANVLLDQDGKPRLADFGQSRLSHEQAPALGTLFYMAPEQASLDAVPDARWDVYALGALFYCMLTGAPPRRTGETVNPFESTPDLAERLAHYRESIESSPPPTEHRQKRGVDKRLAAIVERCLALDPEKRFPNVQAVLDALEERRARLARRPIVVVGAVGPALLLAVVSWFAWHGFTAALQQSNAALTARSLETNGFAAQYVARAAANELDRRYQLVERLAASEWLRKLAADMAGRADLRAMVIELSDPQRTPAELASLRERFRNHPERQAFQKEFEALIPTDTHPHEEEEVASWFFCDANGVSVARMPEGRTIGMNFAWRSYFQGIGHDLPDTWRPDPGRHLQGTHLSDVFRSRATSRWIVAISTPVFDQSPERNFLGVLAMTVQVGRFVVFPGTESQFAVLVDNREGQHKGVILEHPLFDRLLANQPKLPDRFKNYRVREEELPNTPHLEQNYADPMAVDPEGVAYHRRWLARMEPVRVRDKDTGWIVIVQEAYDTAIGRTLKKLSEGLVHAGLLAVATIALVMAVLWGFARRMERGK